MSITGAARKQAGLYYDKGGAVVNVMHPDFGAKGDGTTNDAAAIQAAVDSGATAIIFPLPSASYLIGSSITVTNPGIRLFSEGGAAIKPSAASFNLFTLASTAHRTRFHGLTFNGAAVDNTTVQFAIFSNTSPDDCEVTNCFFGSPANTGPSLNDGIKLAPGNRWNIHDNVFSYLWGTISGTGYGVLCGATNALTAHGNHFIGDSTHGRHAVYVGAGSTYCNVYGNIVENFFSTAFPIYSQTGQPSNIGNKVHGNLIKGGGDATNLTGAAISILGGCSNNVVSNNTITDFAGPGVYVSEFNVGSVNDGNVVDGNTILNVKEQGILIEGVTNTDVTNNKIRDCGNGAGGARAAIQIQNQSIGPVIADKTRVMGNSAHGAAIRCGLTIQQATNTNTVAIGNDFPDGVVGKIILTVAATPLIAKDNYVGITEFVANAGDANITLTVFVHGEVVRYVSALTANRTVTISTTNAYTGAKFRILRTGLGAFTLDVGGLKTIPASTAAFVDVEYDGVGAAWRLTGYGTL